MRITTFQNKKNSNKYIDVKHTNDRHYMWRQRMSWDNGVTNYLGGLPKGGFRRQNVKWINEVLGDYIKVEG